MLEMIELVHKDDKKEKWQSHEVYLSEDCFINAEYMIFSHNPFDAVGYGHSKEDAVEDFKRKFQYIMQELKAFEKMLFETDVITDNIKTI